MMSEVSKAYRGAVSTFRCEQVRDEFFKDPSDTAMQALIDAGLAKQAGAEWREPAAALAAAPTANDLTAVVHSFETEKAKRAAPQPSSPKAKVDDATKQQMFAEVARYIASGLHCIHIAHNGKVPRNNNWRTERLDLEKAQSLYLGEPMPNVGVALGEGSKGVCDVDLDWPLAPAIAEAVTFSDLSAFGRAGKPMSHRLFQCIDLTKDTSLVKFELPDSPCLKAHLPNEHALCVLEIRGNRQQTVFPPSIHSSGEQIAWTEGNTFGMPPPRKWNDIVELGGMTAFLTLMATFYPPEGVRNDFSLALGGALIRALAKDYKDDDAGLIEAVDKSVQAVCRLGGDKGHGRSWTERAANTLAKIRAGKPAWGLTKLIEILGFDTAVEQRIRKWLGAEADDRPVIIYSEGDLGPMVDAAQNVLLAGKEPIYQRGGKLVKPLRLDKSKVDGSDKKGKTIRPAGSLIVGQIDSLSMRVHLTNAAVWRIPSALGTKRGAPPITFASTMLSYKDGWQFPPLLGTADTPTLRDDGTVIAVEGYDEESHIYLDFGGMVFDKVPERPTKQEALDALAKFKFLIKDFAFVDEASRSVALAMMICGVVRRTLPTAPFHLIDASTAGEGKTLLVDAASTIATGHDATLTTFASREELGKRIVSHLLNGDAFVNFDNITMPLDGDTINAMLTHSTLSERILGANNAPPLPTNSMWAGTGNNILVRGDLGRRTLKARLHSGHQRPAERQTHTVRDLKGHILERRAELVIAAIIVVRWLIADGAVIDRALELGSFEQWSRWIRAPLVLLGEADPVETQAIIRDDDPAMQGQIAFANAWRKCQSLNIENWFRVADLMVQMAVDDDLRRAAEGLCPSGLNALTLGHKLRGMMDTPMPLPTSDGKGEEPWHVQQQRRNGEMVYRLTPMAQPQQREWAL